MDIIHALDVAVTLRSKLVRAYQGRAYEEVGLKSVEDGYFKPEEIPGGYPLRIPKQPESFIEITNRAGEVIRHYAGWVVVQQEDEVFVLAEEGDAIVKVYPAEGCVIEGPMGKVTINPRGDNV